MAANFLAPEECTELDLEEISGSDVFAAFPGSPPPPGTHIEIGWASTLRKPIVLLLHEDEEYAFLIRGLHAVGDVTHLYYTRGAGHHRAGDRRRVDR